MAREKIPAFAQDNDWCFCFLSLIEKNHWKFHVSYSKYSKFSYLISLLIIFWRPFCLNSDISLELGFFLYRFIYFRFLFFYFLKILSQAHFLPSFHLALFFLDFLAFEAFLFIWFWFSFFFLRYHSYFIYYIYLLCSFMLNILPYYLYLPSAIFSHFLYSLLLYVLWSYWMTDKSVSLLFFFLLKTTFVYKELNQLTENK